MNQMTVILDPVLGGKIRGVLVTLFAVFVLILSTFPDIQDDSWVGIVTKVYAVIIGTIEILTHGTSAGNSPQD